MAERRNYLVVSAAQARGAAAAWLIACDPAAAPVDYGLPEVDDRYHIWRVPVLEPESGARLGEIVINALDGKVSARRSTRPDLIRGRSDNVVGRPESEIADNEVVVLSDIRNVIAFGDCNSILPTLPAESVGLIFTSPPYFNLRPEYSDYLSYEDYLLQLRKTIQLSHRVLAEGRFFVMNTAPVLLRRSRRSEASRRIAVPFDVHRLFIEEGYDFVDDIVWVKPEGAGWATGRGRRFAADRQPLQYKAVPVTEYVLVYRKRTDKLIDWNIRSHPDQQLLRESRIADDYERTNVWRITPAHTADHPAVFPVELAQRVIRYYSIKGDAVMDPFAGTGTVGRAAAGLGRKFVLIDNNIEYVDLIRRSCVDWLGAAASDVLPINCAPPPAELALL